MLPSIEEANRELKLAEQMNPGPWIQHSINVAEAAKLIALDSKVLDAEKAYVLGLLHDIGRRAGIIAKRHIWEGYKYMMELSWDEVARICLTHSFPVKSVYLDISNDDLDCNERENIEMYLNKIEYDDYDKLIILCDSLADAKGFCLLEKRFIDTTRRYGVFPFTVDRWNNTFQYKEYFERMMGHSVYDILPKVKETTFETLPLWKPSK